MLLLISYLAIGVLNYAHFAVKNRAYIRSLRLPELGPELGFFVLLWPVQVLFFVIVGINSAISYILERLMS